jgi:hypothetical protein
MARIDRNRLKRDIKEKFGSIARFARVCELNYDDTLRVLNSNSFTGDEIENVFYQYDSYDESSMGFYDIISNEERKAIRLSILTNFKNYTMFCKEYSRFDVVYISNVVNGKLKEKTTKFGNLINTLENYNYDEFIT